MDNLSLCLSLGPICVVLIFVLSIASKRFLLRKSTKSLTFSQIRPLGDFNVEKALPNSYRPWKIGKYNMTMGLRRMEENEWLMIDKLYTPEQKPRIELLYGRREQVLQCRPEAEEACKEALECIVTFLTARYPSQFQISEDGPEYIHNAITNRDFRYRAPYEEHPLVVAAQLVMEDINLLIRGSGDDYYLQSSLTLAPAGWFISERMGWPLWKIHAPVPFLNQKLRKAMQRFFLGLKTENPVERNNFFLQVGGAIFQQEPFPETLPCQPRIESIHIRYERQTLRRLPRTGAVIFMVRTYMKPLVDLRGDLESLFALRAAINAWPEDMGRYKGRDAWGATVEEWFEEVLGEFEPDAVDDV